MPVSSKTYWKDINKSLEQFKESEAKRITLEAVIKKQRKELTEQDKLIRQLRDQSLDRAISTINGMAGAFNDLRCITLSAGDIITKNGKLNDVLSSQSEEQAAQYKVTQLSIKNDLETECFQERFNDAITSKPAQEVLTWYQRALEDEIFWVEGYNAGVKDAKADRIHDYRTQEPAS